MYAILYIIDRYTWKIYAAILKHKGIAAFLYYIPGKPCFRPGCRSPPSVLVFMLTKIKNGGKDNEKL